MKISSGNLETPQDGFCGDLKNVIHGYKHEMENPALRPQIYTDDPQTWSHYSYL